MTADEVRARIRTSRRELEELVSSLDEATLSAPRPDGWAIKDHLAHVGAWEHWLLAFMEHRDPVAAMGVTGQERKVDDINAVVWERHRHDSSAEAMKYFHDAHEQLMKVLDEQTSEDFERPYKPFFGDDAPGQPVLVAVAANTYEHYDEHVGWIKALTGSQGLR